MHVSLLDLDLWGSATLSPFSPQAQRTGVVPPSAYFMSWVKGDWGHELGG